MGFFRSIGRAFRSVTNVVKNVGGGLLKTGLSAMTGGGGIGGLIGKIAEKLPLGNILGKVTGFLGKLGPLASMAGGPLGMIGGVLGMLGGKGGGLGKIAEFAQGLLGKLGGAQNLPLPGLNNLTEMFAKSQAQNLLGSFLR
jgi:hypothetical protein